MREIRQRMPPKAAHEADHGGPAQGQRQGRGHLRRRVRLKKNMVVQHKVNAKGGAVFGAALLRPRLRARLIKVVQEKVKAKGGAIFGAAIHRDRPRCRR